MELPRKYAELCQAAMILAASRGRNPQQMLLEVCRIKGVEESEVMEAMQAFALRIEEEDYSSGVRAALTSRTKDLLGQFR
ncbi:MAG: hypothetical protein GKC10_03150 [Methanosarcinales archaeon]|nr:hypothetical protein [Methanosarcinales archaeon]